MARPRPAPDPGRYLPCDRCGRAYAPVARWPDGAVCGYCYLAAKRTEGSCAACGHRGVLPGRDGQGEPTCRRCSGIRLNVDCSGCGGEAELHSRGRCWACVLTEKVRALLTGPRGRVPEPLEPLATALAGMPRPNSGITWLRSPAVQQLLRGLAAGTVPLTHDALDALPAARTIEYVRLLLVEQAVLPGRDRRTADFERWLRRRLDSIADEESRQLLARYGRWHHLRRLRAQSATAPVTEAAFERAKQCVTIAGQFLQWLAEAGVGLDDVRQRHIDQWYAAGTSTAVHVETFLYWCLQHRLLHNVTVPRRTTDNGAVLGEQQRLTALRKILSEDDIALHVRVIAGLVLLYGQPVNRLTRLTVADLDLPGELDRPAGPVRIRLARHWSDVPEQFAGMLTATPWPAPQHSSQLPQLLVLPRRHARRAGQACLRHRPTGRSRSPGTASPASDMATASPAGSARHPRRDARRRPLHRDASLRARRRRLQPLHGLAAPLMTPRSASATNRATTGRPSSPVLSRCSTNRRSS